MNPRATPAPRTTQRQALRLAVPEVWPSAHQALAPVPAGLIGKGVAA